MESVWYNWIYWVVKYKLILKNNKCTVIFREINLKK